MTESPVRSGVKPGVFLVTTCEGVVGGRVGAGEVSTAVTSGVGRDVATTVTRVCTGVGTRVFSVAAVVAAASGSVDVARIRGFAT